MANLGAVFNANSIAPATGEFKVIAPGIYTAMMTDSEVVESKTPGNKMLVCKFEICDGQEKGHVLMARLNLWHASGKASEIAQKEFSAMCHAVMDENERNSVSDSSQLHGRPMAITVDVEGFIKKDGSQGTSNVIKKFERYGMPAAQQPAQQQYAPQPQPQAQPAPQQQYAPQPQQGFGVQPQAGQVSNATASAGGFSNTIAPAPSDVPAWAKKA